MVLLTVMGLIGCSRDDDRAAAPEPAKSVEIGRLYAGRWFEIGRTPMDLTDGCVAGTTDYSRDDSGRLTERDACRDRTPEGMEKLYQGQVTLLNPELGSKFSVRYLVWGFYPVTRTYWVLDHGAEYDWFIVSDPAFENLSLFTRSPRPSGDMVEKLKRRARALGYDAALLEFPPQFPPGEQ